MKYSYLLLAFALAALPGIAFAVDAGDAVVNAIADSGAFPAGTYVVDIIIDGDSIAVDLSPEAIPSGETEADAMVRAVMFALEAFPELTAVELTVGGKPLWEYLPRPEHVEYTFCGIPYALSSEDEPGLMGAQNPLLPPSVSPVSNELSGKLVVLHPSHGSYWHQNYGYWFRAMRTYCGPCPVTNPPPLGGAAYQPSDYYYWTVGYRWPMFYEDDMSPETIRFLKAYCDSSSAATFVSRNLDKMAGDYPAVAFGYPNPLSPLPRWQVAAKYHLQEVGLPSSVWDDPTQTTQTNKDIRARPYYTNYPMQTLGYNDDNTVSFHLHSNAFTSGGQAVARGTETYWYTSTYPYLQAPLS